MKWEHTMVFAKTHGWLVSELMKPGELGWELVSVLLYGKEGDENRVVGFLKRPKATTTPTRRAATAKRASKASPKARKAKASKAG